MITPVSTGAAELEITDVSALAGRADVALLHIVGGGSIYRLTVVNVRSAEGDELEVNEAEFEILFGDELVRKMKAMAGVGSDDALE